MSACKGIKKEPEQEVINILEDMLKEAKDGHIRSFIAVKLFSNGSSAQSWGGLETKDTPKLLGEILMMASRLSVSIDGVDADDIRY